MIIFLVLIHYYSYEGSIGDGWSLLMIKNPLNTFRVAILCNNFGDILNLILLNLAEFIQSTLKAFQYLISTLFILRLSLRVI